MYWVVQLMCLACYEIANNASAWTHACGNRWQPCLGASMLLPHKPRQSGSGVVVQKHLGHIVIVKLAIIQRSL
jgi:hypothetical protein